MKKSHFFEITLPGSRYGHNAVRDWIQGFCFGECETILQEIPKNARHLWNRQTIAVYYDFVCNDYLFVDLAADEKYRSGLQQLNDLTTSIHTCQSLYNSRLEKGDVKLGSLAMAVRHLITAYNILANEIKLEEEKRCRFEHEIFDGRLSTTMVDIY